VFLLVNSRLKRLAYINSDLMLREEISSADPEDKPVPDQEKSKNIKRLKGILPICSNCKNIRNSKGFWEQIEVYIKNRSEADFSHTLCPDCETDLYGQDKQAHFKKIAGRYSS